MAKGRMVNRTVCKDKRVHNLSNDTSRLALTWLITFADCEGRTYGDPALVKSMVFPRREEGIDADYVSASQMEDYLVEWHNAGLIVWYEANGDRWIWFPAFEKNQPGLRKERETPSVIPEYVKGVIELCGDGGVTPQTSRVSCGVTPQQSQSSCGIKEWNGIEGNGIEEKAGTLSKTNYRDIAESVHGGQVNPVLIDDIQWLVDNSITQSEIDEAIEIANMKKGADMSWSKWRYAMACIKNIVNDRSKPTVKAGMSTGLNPTMEIC